MLDKIFGSSKSSLVPSKLLEGIINQSRSEIFFSEFGVPDTVIGRFDMLSLHTYLLSRRIRKENDQGLFAPLNQDIFDLYVEDIERALRQIGIGDTSVPKRKKRMVRSFFGLVDDFDRILDGGDSSEFLIRVKNRFIPDSDVEPDLLGQYINATEAWLEGQSASSILAGSLAWNNPDYTQRIIK